MLRRIGHCSSCLSILARSRPGKSHANRGVLSKPPGQGEFQMANPHVDQDANRPGNLTSMLPASIGDACRSWPCRFLREVGDHSAVVNQPVTAQGSQAAYRALPVAPPV